MNDALPCECGALRRRYAAEKEAAMLAERAKDGAK
jgi:hypothetical protein